MSDKIDIVIPIGPNDMNKINNQIEYTKKNIVGYRTIYLISYDNSLKIDDCITIPENIFPFSLETVVKYHGKLSRNGWYYQQLLKLYAGFVIPDILDKYLVIDADTFFLKPITFYENGKALYNYGTEHHKPYFIHMEKLHPELKRIDGSKSGICHHMLFETKYIKELFKMVESNHSDEKSEEFYDIFLKNVDETDYEKAGASEYEIYFNYMLCKYPDNIQIRKLNWKNVNNLNDLNYDYVSNHWHMRW